MIVGHKKQINFLRKMISKDSLPHALMFEGMSGLGKKKLAVHLFKEINCTQKQREKPCDYCQNCLLINHLSHPDFILVEAEKKEIQINQIREVIRKMSFRCYSSDSKWVIIDNAHLMNQEASNSLLKILEEPKKNTVIILITEHSESILGTIKSRVQRIKFFPLRTKEIIYLLESLNSDWKKNEEIAAFSFGLPGKAVEFSLDRDKIKSRKNEIKKLAEIFSSEKPFYLKFKYAKERSVANNPLSESLEIWLSYLRNFLLEKARKNEIDGSFRKTKFRLEKIEKSIYWASKTNVNNRMIIENLILNI